MSFFDHYAKFGYDFTEDVREVLLTDAAETVKDIMLQTLDEKVYSYVASEAAMESRRYTDGGLAARENMAAHVEPGYELVVENVAPFQDKWDARKGHDLSDVVDQGIPGYNQPGARPFVSDTESECVSSGAVLRAINEALKRKGYQIEYLEGGI